MDYLTRQKCSLKGIFERAQEPKNAPCFNMRFLTIAFDFDGVLADTLPQHFEFCQAEARKFKIVLPKKSQREIVDNPMERLLKKAGFPENILPLVIADYEREFSDYQISLFDRVPEMLRKLKAAGRVLTIASSNRLVNIKKSLGELFLLFDCISAYDTDSSKSAGLKRILACTSPPQVLVGDTEKDYQAACDAGTNFIGASYGWQISSDDKRFPVAHSVPELESLLLA